MTLGAAPAPGWVRRRQQLCPVPSAGTSAQTHTGCKGCVSTPTATTPLGILFLHLPVQIPSEPDQLAAFKAILQSTETELMPNVERDLR